MSFYRQVWQCDESCYYGGKYEFTLVTLGDISSVLSALNLTLLSISCKHVARCILFLMLLVR